MFAYIQGKLTVKNPTKVVLDVNGVGYEFDIPISTYESIGQLHEQVKLLTYVHVREDILQLYGFSDEKQKSLFLKLISVSGVGPKLAQGILSKISVDNFTQAMITQNHALLTQVPGVGNKMAQRLVTELRDKFSKAKDAGISFKSDSELKLGEKAAAALVSLGYREIEASKMVGSVLNSNGDELSLENVVKLALQKTK
ncbi:Holliday junction branch migration protein RuvA [candidate division KSB1 bacterium]|nr:Holliday junction branch migration protein RuvA [candidate division KSB1 bacterium]